MATKVEDATSSLPPNDLDMQDTGATAIAVALEALPDAKMADLGVVSAAPTLLSDPPKEPETPAPPPEPEMPENACETLYIQNLNESVKIDVIKQTLSNLFKNYGEVVDVVAHRNLRLRGQAFVSFKDKDAAFKALREVEGFPLYAKNIKISFAKSRSDKVVQQLASDEFATHKARRLEHKKKQRWDNPLKQKARAKHNATAQTEGAANAANAKRTAVMKMPDEYLPPNKILFIQALPESTTQQVLLELFSQHPNLIEVRMIPTKRDIAFVEFGDEASSTVAKDALHNYKIDGEHKIKITFARK